jgi:hypothetical protein
MQAKAWLEEAMTEYPSGAHFWCWRDEEPLLFPRRALSEVAKLWQIEAAIDRQKKVENGRREVSGGAQRIARSRCKICRSKIKWQCAQCQVYLCARKLNGKESDCIVNHLESIRSEFASDPSP